MISLNLDDTLSNGANVIEHNADKGLVLGHYRGAARPYIICNIDNEGFCSGETHFLDLFKAAHYYAIQVFITKSIEVA
jgi:hypothetical protein